MRAIVTTAGPIAAGLTTGLVLLGVSQSILLQMAWYQPALTVDTGFDLAMQALERKILIDSIVVFPATAVIVGVVVGLLSRSGAGIAAAVACVPVLTQVAGSASWLRALIQVAAYGGIAWVSGTLAYKWRHRKAGSTS